ncbi:glyoxalase/bleomycin resistance/extradiol dioxygenase family protein [Flammeovirga aprica]|uniref:Glyoxalase/bleomycin resistance/extradiol dioxygenase family protein n=1 Tax=Flammeovirga aprica JL-4 TaxID=694437 RepID=A0A7X9S278_9BACT|nr:glyoxalase/bleomycin resistance/extradiol dioxygenase family protein [Flammeovirga aprica]NME72936.1 glyoxalase/bleomycin resistance/extradiol dioxygenase family protein [Flammeovirga aprica JL-4]
MTINLLVIRTKEPSLLKAQYEMLGFDFDYHQHGNGPYHYAAEKNGFVFEIYPLTKSMEKADNSIRIGFDINDLEVKMMEIENSNWIIKSKLKETEWGMISVLQDLDGRKIELKNT